MDPLVDRAHCPGYMASVARAETSTETSSCLAPPRGHSLQQQGVSLCRGAREGHLHRSPPGLSWQSHPSCRTST